MGPAFECVDIEGYIEAEVGPMEVDLYGEEEGELMARAAVPNGGLIAHVMLDTGEYGKGDLVEVANMLARVLRSYYIRTRIMPLVCEGCRGGTA